MSSEQVAVGKSYCVLLVDTDSIPIVKYHGFKDIAETSARLSTFNRQTYHDVYVG